MKLKKIFVSLVAVSMVGSAIAIPASATVRAVAAKSVSDNDAYDNWSSSGTNLGVIKYGGNSYSKLYGYAKWGLIHNRAKTKVIAYDYGLQENAYHEAVIQARYTDCSGDIHAANAATGWVQFGSSDWAKATGFLSIDK